MSFSSSKADFHTVKLQLDLTSVAQKCMTLPKETDSDDQVTRVCDAAVKGAEMLRHDFNIDESAQTVRKFLKNQKKRLEFAKMHQHWTINDWNRVIWYDESKIDRFNYSTYCKTWRRFSDGVGIHDSSWSIDGRLDAELFCKILEDELMQTLEYYEMEKDATIFHQDNDLKHISRKAKKCLQDLDMRVLQWPPQSPDLNPIEDLWDVLKRELSSYQNPSQGIHELWERIEKKWNAISKEECTAIIASMPRRIHAVLKAKDELPNIEV
uniref:Transposase putative n=1 Tax=Albugo laibachii Nc14 TaxID=890382 RepID=F0WHA8_9STRA|nr:transposase putative [Albugo laibachii Nc14]|eukprot:CCA20624.1 transposase putative [Albugo laibachii Nc14]